eukprot:1043174_1
MNKLVILWLFVFVSISVAPDCSPIGEECTAGPPPPGPSCEPIGGECNEEADCCGPAGNQGCEGDTNKKCCGRDKVRCPQGHDDCCGGFHCDQGSGECKEGSAPPPPPGPPPPGPSCEPIGGECNEEADCCGPAGNQG